MFWTSHVKLHLLLATVLIRVVGDTGEPRSQWTIAYWFSVRKCGHFYFHQGTTVNYYLYVVNFGQLLFSLFNMVLLEVGNDMYDF